MFIRLNAFLEKLRKEKKGVTAIEYGLIAALIAVAIIAAVGAVGTQLNTKFGQVSTGLQNAPAPSN